MKDSFNGPWIDFQSPKIPTNVNFSVGKKLLKFKAVSRKDRSMIYPDLSYVWCNTASLSSFMLNWIKCIAYHPPPTHQILWPLSNPYEPTFAILVSSVHFCWKHYCCVSQPHDNSSMSRGGKKGFWYYHGNGPGLLLFSKDFHRRSLCFDKASYLNVTHQWNCFVSGEYGKHQLYYITI